MKKTAAAQNKPSPVVRNRLAEMLDALSAECFALARDERARVEDYERVATDIETLAEVLRESELAQPGDRRTEWTLADRAKDMSVARTIESVTRIRVDLVDRSGERPSLTLEQAKRVIEDLRAEDAVRNDVQRALA